MPWKRGSTDTNRPLAPFGMACVHSFSATCGASRLATAQALGGLKIKAPLPATSHLLLEALSQALTSGGRNAESRCKYSSAWRVASDLMVISPFSLTSSAPKARNKAPSQSTLSVAPPSGSPNGYPALWHLSAASKKLSQVQSSTALLGAPPAGNIDNRSMPARSFMRSMRLQAVR